MPLSPDQISYKLNKIATLLRSAVTLYGEAHLREIPLSVGKRGDDTIFIRTLIAAYAVGQCNNVIRPLLAIIEAPDTPQETILTHLGNFLHDYLTRLGKEERQFMLEPRRFASPETIENTLPYLHIAQLLAEHRSESPLLYFMPTLSKEMANADLEEIAGDNANTTFPFYDFAQYILSDDGRRLIHVYQCLFYAKDDAILKHTSFCDRNGAEITVLGESEKSRLLAHYPEARVTYGAIETYKTYLDTDESAFAALTRLIVGLQAGSTHGGTGSNDSSSEPANAAISGFERFLAQLTPEDRTRLFAIRRVNPTDPTNPWTATQNLGYYWENNLSRRDYLERTEQQRMQLVNAQARRSALQAQLKQSPRNQAALSASLDNENRHILELQNMLNDPGTCVFITSRFLESIIEDQACQQVLREIRVDPQNTTLNDRRNERDIALRALETRARAVGLEDPHVPIHMSLHRLFLRTIHCSIPERIISLFENLEGITLENIIPNHTQLAALIQAISADLSLNEQDPRYLQTPFFNLLQDICSILRNKGDHLRRIFHSADNYNLRVFLQNLDNTRCLPACEVLRSEISYLIQDGRLLAILLNDLNESKCIAVCAALRDKWAQLLADDPMFDLLAEFGHPDTRLLDILNGLGTPQLNVILHDEIFRQHLLISVNNPEKLNRLIRGLNAPNRTITYNFLMNIRLPILPAMVQNYQHLSAVLEGLSEQESTAVFTQLTAKLPQLLLDFNRFELVVGRLSPMQASQLCALLYHKFSSAYTALRNAEPHLFKTNFIPELERLHDPISKMRMIFIKMQNDPNSRTSKVCQILSHPLNNSEVNLVQAVYLEASKKGLFSISRCTGQGIYFRYPLVMQRLNEAPFTAALIQEKSAGTSRLSRIIQNLRRGRP